LFTESVSPVRLGRTVAVGSYDETADSVRSASPAGRRRSGAGGFAVTDSGHAPRQWRKSSKSNYGGCVEVSFVDGGEVAVRNSRDPDGPVLYFTSAEWDAFLSGAVAREFDRP
jgi:hypothetical protein